MASTEYDIIGQTVQSTEEGSACPTTLKQICGDTLKKIQEDIDRFTNSCCFVCPVACTMLAMIACFVSFFLIVATINKANDTGLSIDQISSDLTRLHEKVDRLMAVQPSGSESKNDESTVTLPFTTILPLLSTNRTDVPDYYNIHPIIRLLDESNPDRPIHFKSACQDLPLVDEIAFVRDNASVDAKIITVAVASFPKCPRPGNHENVIINYTTPVFPPKQMTITRTCDAENGRQISTPNDRIILYDPKNKEEPAGILWTCKCRFGDNGPTFTKRNLRDIRKRVCMMTIRLRFDKHDRFGKLLGE